VFNIGWGASIKRITDGTSKTIMMGDASGDTRWQVCHLRGCTVAVPETSTNELPYAWFPWIAGQPNSTPYYGGGKWVAVSLFAATVEPMNKNPVTDSYIETASLNSKNPAVSCADSRGAPYSYPDASGTGVGKNSASNFRSNHPGGCNFLMADGSAAFLNESIAMLVYQAMSSIAGDEVLSE
jgi:prepilin-type processing-associated H-X9-DG protein